MISNSKKIIILFIGLLFLTSCELNSDVISGTAENIKYNSDEENSVAKSDNTIIKANGKHSHISDEAYKYLDNNQIEVYCLTEKIYEALLNASINELITYTDGSLDQYYLDYANNFLSTDKNKELAKTLASYLNYQVMEMYNGGDKVYASIEYTYPSLAKLTKKILPTILFKNAKTLLSGKIDDETIASILETMVDTIKDGKIENEKYTNEFAFKKVNGTWKLTDTETLYDKLTKYMSGLLGK